MTTVHAAPPEESAESGTSPAALRVDGLSVSYGAVPAVRDVTFRIDRGEILGLVGESGSGKSSVCAAIMRLLPRSADARGSVRLGDRDLMAMGERALCTLRGHDIALVPQQPMSALSPTVPVGRQLRWYFGDAWDTEELRASLQGIGLQVLLDRPGDLPGQFSGGQLQRMLIAAAALARRPSVVLADEPTTTLDATVQVQVLRLLLDLRDRLGLSLLYVSHDLAVIAQVCDRVGVMYGGRLVEVASVLELFATPRHPYTRSLLAAVPSGGPEQGRLRPIPGSAAGANRLSGCPFAPRCPIALDLCHRSMPAPVTIGGSTVRCHRAEP